MSPKVDEQKLDTDLQEAKDKVLADLLGRKAKSAVKVGRRMTSSQANAVDVLERGVSFEVVMSSAEYGGDKVDPITKQVDPFAKQSYQLITVIVEPEEPQWIEHLMKACQGLQLKKSEIELFKKHIRRLNYQGALRDHYEFYGLTIRELKEKVEVENQKGDIAYANRLKKMIERIDKR